MVHRIRITVAAAAVLTLAACAKKEAPATDTATAMAAPAAAPAPASVSLADFAGKWNMETRNEVATDTVVTRSVLVATADTSGWMLQLPSGKKIADNHVSVSADSLMMRSDPYSSMRRKGTQVWTEGVYRLQNGKLVGTTIAHYASGADSVVRLRTEGTKQ